MVKQRTLKSITRAVGVGIHSGQKVELTLRPAPPDTGIVFRRVDLCPPVDIPVGVMSVSDTRMATTISPDGDPGGPKVQTIEHLLSACAGLGLDNIVIDINADEVPVLDGSAASFVFLLQSAGIELQNAPKRFLKVKKPVEVRQGEGKKLMWARLEPHHGYTLSFEIEKLNKEFCASRHLKWAELLTTVNERPARHRRNFSRLSPLWRPRFDLADATNPWPAKLEVGIKEPIGVSTTGQRDAAMKGHGIPWLMLEGTAGAHIMIPINE